MPRRGFGASDGAVRPRLRVVNSAPEIVLAAILALFISSAATDRPDCPRETRAIRAQGPARPPRRTLAFSFVTQCFELTS